MFCCVVAAVVIVIVAAVVVVTVVTPPCGVLVCTVIDFGTIFLKFEGRDYRSVSSL